MATPTRAVEAASWRSATRMSGRRRSSPAGSPTAVICGSCRQLARRCQRGHRAHWARGREHGEAVNGARHLAPRAVRWWRASCDSCAWAREVSSSVPRPASSRACVSSQRLALVVDVALRDGELRLLAAQLEVGARHLGGHRYLGIAQRRPPRPRPAALLRLHVAAHAAEEVQLPEGIEAGLVEMRYRAARRRRLCDGRDSAHWCSRPRR